MNAVPSPDDCFPLSVFAQRQPKHVKSLGALRWHCARREQNGMAAIGAVVETATGRLVIHEPSFFAWYFGVDRGDAR
jgi:hypothetical protein